MSDWNKKNEKCWRCKGSNTETRGQKEPEEMYFSCYDCGLRAHYDGEMEITSEGRTEVYHCPKCKMGGKLGVETNIEEPEIVSYKIWCLSCGDHTIVETPTKSMISFGESVLDEAGA